MLYLHRLLFKIVVESILSAFKIPSANRLMSYMLYSCHFSGFDAVIFTASNRHAFLTTYYSTRLSQEHYTINNCRLFFTVLLPYGCFLKKMLYINCLISSKLAWVLPRVACFLPNIVQENDLLWCQTLLTS